MAALDLTTLPNVKAWLNISDTQNDALLTRLISEASEFAESWCSRSFNLATYIESRNGLGGQIMVMLNQPIASVSSVMVSGLSVPAQPPYGQPVTTSGPPGGYVFDASRIMLYGYWFARGFQNVVVNYTAGYTTPPYDLEQAVIDIVGAQFKYRSRIGKVSEGLEQQTTVFSQAQVPPMALARLQTYKQVAPIY